MYPDHIRAAAGAMARNMADSEMPLYGESLRLPDRKAVIGLIKEVRRLMFPAYYGDATLMTLPPEEYAALLLGRIEKSLRRQIALALPEEEAHRAEAITREFIDCLPSIQAMLLKDLDATFDGDPAAQDKNEILFAYPGLFAIFVYRIAHELYLRKVLTANNTQSLMEMGADEVARAAMRAETIKYSVIVVSSIPMLIIYPFVQKFFVKGVMIGAVKG